LDILGTSVIDDPRMRLEKRRYFEA